MKGILAIVTMSFIVATSAMSPVQAQQGGVVVPNIGTDIYKLDASSYYTEGCIAPCKCAVRLFDEIRGTFKAELSSKTPTKAEWMISNINWLVTTDTEELYITGGGSLFLNKGTYDLKLDLNFGDQSVSYESGPVPEVGDFPGNLSVELVIPGASCFTTTFSIDATELKVDEIKKYGLQNGAYSSGCGLDPDDNLPGCLCPIQLQNLVGDFGLVSLGLNSKKFNEYSLVNIDLAAASFTMPPIEQFDIGGDAIFRLAEPPKYKEAFGRFTFGDSGKTVPMSSGLIIGGDEFPQIEIGVLDELPGCFGQSLYIDARPPTAVLLGDANGDGVLDNLDIAPFSLALFNPVAYAAAFPDVDPDVVLDMNNDGVFNNLDIAGFAAALFGP